MAPHHRFNGAQRESINMCERDERFLVRGRIHYTKWTDQQGVDRYGCEIIAETVDFLSRAETTQNSGDNTVDDDEIPVLTGGYRKSWRRKAAGDFHRSRRIAAATASLLAMGAEVHPAQAKKSRPTPFHHSRPRTCSGNPFRRYRNHQG